MESTAFSAVLAKHGLKLIVEQKAVRTHFSLLTKGGNLISRAAMTHLCFGYYINWVTVSAPNQGLGYGRLMHGAMAIKAQNEGAFTRIPSIYRTGGGFAAFYDYPLLCSRLLEKLEIKVETETKSPVDVPWDSPEVFDAKIIPFYKRSRT